MISFISLAIKLNDFNCVVTDEKKPELILAITLKYVIILVCWQKVFSRIALEKVHCRPFIHTRTQFLDFFSLIFQESFQKNKDSRKKNFLKFQKSINCIKIKNLYRTFSNISCNSKKYSYRNFWNNSNAYMVN